MICNIYCHKISHKIDCRLHRAYFKFDFPWRKPINYFGYLSKEMRSLLIFSAVFILIMMTQSSLGGPSCLDDNTVYFGYNLVNPATNRKNTSMECQLACQYNPRCQYWSWMKKCAREGFNNWWCEIGRCHLYSTKQAPGFPPAKRGTNSYYVSGSKYCTHVSKAQV